MAEVLHKNMAAIQESRVLDELQLEVDKYILVSAHREENIDNEKTFESLMHAINFAAETYNMPMIYSTHPRSWKRIEDRGFVVHKNVRQSKPFGFFDYNKLQMNSFCVLSDSGTLSEESAILGFSGILIRTSTERPEVLDKGTVIIGGVTERDIVQSIELARAMKANGEPVALAPDYQDRNVSAKIVKIIQSYVTILNRTIWG